MRRWDQISRRRPRVIAPTMVAALMLVCACLAPLAPAAQPARDPKVGRGGAKVTVLADFGFVGNVVAHRWTPIFVTVDPGPRGLSGMVEIEFRQDESQRARISVPFAAAAGTPTRVQAVAALPLNVPRVQVRVLDESGRVRASTMYSKLASDTAAQLPPILPTETAMVVAAGRSSVLAAGRAWRTNASAVSRWTTVVVVPSLDLPTDSIAYDGAAAMVVTARAALTTDPFAINAIHDWVRAGGRLIILADAPGGGWASWLPPEVRGTIELGEAQRVGVPAALQDAVRKAPFAFQVQDAEGVVIERPTHALPDRAVDTVLARPVSVRPGTPAADMLWRMSDGTALAAAVPAGFGTVMVLGLDPVDATATRSPEHAATAWQGVISHVLDDIVQLGDLSDDQRRTWGVMLDPASLHVFAVSRIAASLIGSQTISPGFFWALGGVMLALVLLVGPIDAIVLRRLGLRHRSWATALAWIALASAAAFIMPRQIRGSETRVQRFSTIDAMVTPPGQRAGQGPAFQTGLTGIFAGASGPVPIQSPTPRTFFRGASTNEWSWWSGRTDEPGGVVPVVQAAAGGADGSARGGRIPALPMAMWTFRALLDQGPARIGLWAEVRGAEADQTTVRIVGLPEGVNVGWVSLRIRDRAWQIKGERRPDGVWEATPGEGKRVELIGRRFTREWMSSGWPSVYLPTIDPSRAVASGEVMLPGTDRRTRGIDRLVASGRFAAIEVQVLDWPPEITGPDGAQAQQAVLLRLVTPLDLPEPHP